MKCRLVRELVLKHKGLAKTFVWKQLELGYAVTVLETVEPDNPSENEWHIFVYITEGQRCLN